MSLQMFHVYMICFVECKHSCVCLQKKTLQGTFKLSVTNLVRRWVPGVLRVDLDSWVACLRSV